MGLFSFPFFKRKSSPAPETRKRTPPPQDPVTVEALRTRARRRLIGAAVLVGGAVVGLPTLFDKPPRPANQSFNVRMAAPDGGATVSVRPTAPAAPEPRPLASVSPPMPPATAGLLPGTGKKPPADEAIITEAKPDPKAEAAARAAREQAQADRLRADKLKADKAREAERIREAEQAREAEKARVARANKKAKEAKEAREAKEKEAQEAREAADARREAARKAKDAKEAKQAKEAHASRTEAADDKPRRYVIQAGSFAEASAARDLGRRIDKLGLDSHEQRVETAAGQSRTRVRLGPFKTKEEAQRAATRLKAAGLNAAVLPL
jgi:DedD protein